MLTTYRTIQYKSICFHKTFDWWRDNLVITGGIPEDLLLESSHSDSDLEDYLDIMFKDIVPGDKIIIGIADSIPPDAKFDRVLRIGDRVRKECLLPMQV